MVRFIVLDRQQAVADWLSRIVEACDEERRAPQTHLLLQAPAFYGGFHGARGFTVVAVDGGRLAGFALMGLGDAISEIYAADIARLGVPRALCGSHVQALVCRGWRGQGLGRALFERRCVAAYARGVRHSYFTTHPDNAHIQAIARRMGAIELDRRRVYSANVMRVIYRLDLPGQTLAGR